MQSRFGLINRLDYYDANELAEIVTRSASILNVDIEPTGALEIASRSRGTPVLPAIFYVALVIMPK